MRRITILGGGESGVGSAILAKSKGFDIFLSDIGKIENKYKEELIKHNIDFEEEKHSNEKILQSSEIIKSPGIPDSAEIIKKLRTKNIPIISEIEFAGRYTNAKVICITGSNGKTTTTSLIYHILKSANINVGLGGNIGKSFARQVAENDFDYYVLELSSFQLEGMYDFRAHISVLLNITPDHLDRYNNNMQNYIDAKMRIIRNQQINDALIYWVDDPIVTKEIEKLKPKATLYPFSQNYKEGSVAYLKDKNINISVNNEIFNMQEELLSIKGTHNMYNTLASGIVAKLLYITDDKLKKSLSDFKGVPHRLERVVTIKGVEYINDSKATNVNSCWYALESLNNKIVLILGGTDKGNDYTIIEDLIKSKVHTLIFLGKDNSKLQAFFGDKCNNIYSTNSMEEAVKRAYTVANKGETVLLSPCCASFDLFKNYEERGDLFKKHVRKL